MYAQGTLRSLVRGSLPRRYLFLCADGLFPLLLGFYRTRASGVTSQITPTTHDLVLGLLKKETSQGLSTEV